MDNRFTKRKIIPFKTGEGQLIKGNFALFNSPVDVQLTVHINNLISYHGSDVIKIFKDILFNPDNLNKLNYGDKIPNIINNYGLVACRKWFTSVYGWNFQLVEVK